MRSKLQLTTTILMALAVAACASNQPEDDQVFLMPAPDVFEEGEIDPFVDNDPISRGVLPYILYATDRMPAAPDDENYNYFSYERGPALELGRAGTRLVIDEDISWEEARRISLLKDRADNYPMEVADVESFGPLASTVQDFDDATVVSPEPGRKFAAAIDEQLSHSTKKDVYIYVHGYKVNFENPVLVASELWHFLGYNGAFIAYSWPTKFDVFDYLAALDNSINSARSLRELILYVSENTDAEKIHVVGYSMGTRVVSRMLADLGMYGYFMDDDEIRQRTRLGSVILIGSDVDRSIIGGYLIDGALRIPESLTIYQSSADGALNMSKTVFGRERAGQLVDDIGLGERSTRFFAEHPELRIIDVTAAEGAAEGGGHSYFRSSPWVSSDILMTLMYDIPPADRGLVLRDDMPVWTFPPDYVTELRRALARVDPTVKAPDADSESGE